MLFLKVLNMSLTATWLMAAVLILRLVLKKSGGRIKMLLWLLLAVKLVCPFSFESQLSMVPSAEPLPPEIIYEARPNIDSGIESIDDSVNPVIEEVFAANLQGSVNPIQVYIIIASWIWGAVMAAMFLYAFISYMLLKRKAALSVNIYDNVYICDHIGTSFVMGFIRPRIYLDSAMEQEQADYVVRHEQAHIRRADHWRKPIAFAVLTLHCFNPLVWLCYVLFCRDIELACDEAVISEMDLEEKKNYSEALLACSIHSARLAVCPVAFGEINVKSRIKAVLKYKKAPLWLALISLLLCALAALLFLTDPKEDKLKQYAPEDFQELGHAVLMSEFGEREITEKWKLQLLAEKLSSAKEVGAETACPLEMTLTVTKADGEMGEILIASDGCEVFSSNGVYYEYGVNETGSILELFGFKHFWEDRELDEEGRLVKKTGYNWFEPFGITEYTYEGDLLVSLTDRDGSGKLQGYFEYEYDEQGKEVLQRHYLPDDNGELQLMYEMELIYDEQGNFKETVQTYKNTAPNPQPPPGEAGTPGIYSVATSHADELQLN